MAKSSTSWQPGTTGNPKGRAPRQQESRYLELFRECVTEKDWRAIITRAVREAKNNDRYARDFIAQFLLPTPPKALELSTADALLLAQALQAVQQLGYTPSQIFTDLIAAAHESIQEANHEPEP